MRLFIAIDLPEAVKDALMHLHVPLAGARWTRRESLHLTLQFLGDGIPKSQLAAIRQTLDRLQAESFPLVLRGVGQFPAGKKPARVLWAGIDPSAALSALAGEVHSAMSAIGFMPDTRPFSPHITLARLHPPAPANTLAAFYALRHPFVTPAFPVTSIVLYESQLTPAGPLYTEQARQALH